MAHPVGGYLERGGLLERDTGHAFQTHEAVAGSDEDPSIDLLGSSITYRIALGPQQGLKAFASCSRPMSYLSRYTLAGLRAATDGVRGYVNRF